MTKIASLAPYKIMPPVKGGERHVFFFLKHIAKYSEVTCFTVKENTSIGENIKCNPVLGSQSNKLRYINPFLYFRLKKELQKAKIQDLIIEHPYFGWVGFLLQKFTGIRFTIRSHNIESYRFRSLGKWWWKLLYYYEHFVHQKAHLNLFITAEDRQFAIKHFLLEPEKCMVSTYGIELNRISTGDKNLYKEKLCKENDIDPATKLILFNGALGYKPNSDAVDRIIYEINPRLKEWCKVPYKIIICGKGLPAAYNNLQHVEGILFKGFVEDIQQYFKGADVFINPITEGGGIKTKLVEALGSNTPAVSFLTGAYGVPVALAGNSLTLMPDLDYVLFVNGILKYIEEPFTDIPEAFYNYFDWNEIAKQAIVAIEEKNKS